jgi:murein DD-endopeptidase MepM/ murein hydrolase activator NlpD
VPDRPPGARHRAPRAPGHRRRLGGLALPTVAAAALALTATGASIDAHPQAELSASSPVMRSAQQQSQEQRLAQTDRQVARTGSAQVAAMATGRAEATQRAARAARRQAIAARAARALALALARARAWRLPITHYTLTSGFGQRWGRLHAGNDFAAPVGSRLVAMSTGTVTFAGAQSGYGNKVEIRYWDGTVSYYGHMDRVTAHVGQKVGPGSLVGYSGNTGHSTGPHLHLEIHPVGHGPVNPMPWLRAHGIRP